MTRQRFSVALFLLSILVVPALAAKSEDYAGQYVLRLGTRNFMVLNLHAGTNGKLTGSLARPAHSSLGSSFSKISAETIIEPINSATLRQDHLHLIAANPIDPSDTDEFDLSLLSPDGALLKVSDFPIDPWHLARVARSPLLTVATDWDLNRVYFPGETGQEISNPEMQRIMDEDQKPRQSIDMSKADWTTIDKQDEQRRGQVRELLSRGALHSGQDFEQAAFVFQHGGAPDDYLLAHTLAMIAIARGNPGALWIATATLDRYLNSIKQSQIYGTQFYNNEKAWTQEPYNRTLISDELRLKLGVPSQAVQQEQLEQYKTANHP